MTASTEATVSRLELTELERPELESVLTKMGEARFRARQLFAWIYQHGVTDLYSMTDLPKQLRAKLTEEFSLTTPTVLLRERSNDGTEKFLLRLLDGRQIESVYIPDTPAMTFCVSTQVGCAMACAFCLTGKMGLARNLSAGEIAGQVRVMSEVLGLRTSTFNVVLMGMGEPLHNYSATMKALRILGDEHGFALPPRRVTLSTVGLLPELGRLAREPFMPNLAISLHAPVDQLRRELVPIGRKHTVIDIIEACKQFPIRKRRRITFEYVLLGGVNDSADDAATLCALLRGMHAKVNLIPLNAAQGIPFERPSDESIDRFAGILANRGVIVSVRKSRGRDIRAACGQLIVDGVRKSPGQQLADIL